MPIRNKHSSLLGPFISYDENKANVFVQDRLFQPNLIFASKVRAYLSEVAPLYGRLLALPTNIRLRWKSLQGRNTQTYLAHSLVTNEPSKLECLLLANFAGRGCAYPCEGFQL